LPEFEFLLARLHIDQEYVKDASKNLRRDRKHEEFTKKMLEKYRNLPTDKKKKNHIIPGFDGKGMASIPLSKYAQEKKEFFKDEPELLD